MFFGETGTAASAKFGTRPAARESGFTLFEIAIVLLVMGILFGVVMKGQELITAARVRGIIAQHDDIRTAYFAFIGRYGAPPGDYAQAATHIGGLGTVCGSNGNGNGNGRVELANGESVLVWEHLSRSGLLTGVYRCAGNTTIDQASSPPNGFNQFQQLVFDNNFAGDNTASRHNLKTGAQMPSYLLSEIDRKIDDGNARDGIFRGSAYTTGAAVDAGCWDTTTGAWAAAAQNCSAARIF